MTERGTIRALTALRRACATRYAARKACVACLASAGVMVLARVAERLGADGTLVVAAAGTLVILPWLVLAWALRRRFGSPFLSARRLEERFETASGAITLALERERVGTLPEHGSMESQAREIARNVLERDVRKLDRDELTRLLSGDPTVSSGAVSQVAALLGALLAAIVALPPANPEQIPEIQAVDALEWRMTPDDEPFPVPREEQTDAANDAVALARKYSAALANLRTSGRAATEPLLRDDARSGRAILGTLNSWDAAFADAESIAQELTRLLAGIDVANEASGADISGFLLQTEASGAFSVGSEFRALYSSARAAANGLARGNPGDGSERASFGRFDAALSREIATVDALVFALASGEEIAAVNSRLELLLESSIAGLAAHAGEVPDPGAGSPEAETFLVRLDGVREASNAALGRMRELRALIASEYAEEALNALADAGTSPALAPSEKGLVRATEALTARARSGHWGRTTEFLEEHSNAARFLAASGEDPADSSAALVGLLVLGSGESEPTGEDFIADLPGVPESSVESGSNATGGIGDGTASEELEGASRERGPGGDAHGAGSILYPPDPGRARSDAETVQTDRSTESGATSDQVGEFDPAFAGGASTRETASGKDAEESDRAFYATLPKREEQVRTPGADWRPDAISREKSRIFRERLSELRGGVAGDNP